VPEQSDHEGWRDVLVMRMPPLKVAAESSNLSLGLDYGSMAASGAVCFPVRRSSLETF